MPSMGKIQMIADYFHIQKSDLVEDKSVTPNGNKEIRFSCPEYTVEQLNKISEYAQFLKDLEKKAK